jgi:hypothetical protein
LATHPDKLYEVLYDPLIDELEEPDEIFNKSFQVKDGAELFKFLGGPKEEITSKGLNLTNTNNEEFKLLSINSVYAKKNYSIMETLNSIDDDTFCIDSDNALLYLDGKKIITGFNVNDLCDLISKEVSSIADHTLPILQLQDNELHVCSEFTKIDPTLPFMILDSKAFRKVKLLKKDDPFLEFYMVNNRIIINYGVLNKEHFSISGNGMLTP